MFIKVLDGRFAGQVRDIENGAALALLKEGRAEKAFTEPLTAASEPRAKGRQPWEIVLPAGSRGAKKSAVS